MSDRKRERQSCWSEIVSNKQVVSIEKASGFNLFLIQIVCHYFKIVGVAEKISSIHVRAC